MSRFHPELYRKHRPFYPAETFSGFRERLRDRGFNEPFRVADIGCGTGHSAVSLIRAGLHAEVIAIDPDPAMIAEARPLIEGSFEIPIDLRVGQGEKTGLPAESVDAVTVGSALHWMDVPRTRDEFHRILRPRGLVRIFEYQFPKARNLPELNEWIRRQFNLHWKAPRQVPRGDLEQISAPFRDGSGFRILGHEKPSMVLSMNAGELAGLLFSQSRFLHFEAGLPEPEREKHRLETLSAITERMGNDVRRDFDFKLAWIEFEKARAPS